MTSAANARYTPLESLLLFQALRADGIDSISFHDISNDLQKIPLITRDPSFDAARLSPDALRDLYLGLLKDEVKRDLERKLAHDGNDHVTNGDVSPGSRKRKAPSPSLPTVREAAQHSHLIPQLVTRLYARYRENIIRDIRDSERKHDAAVHETEDIRAGKLDEQLRKQQASSATQSPKPSTTAHTQPAVSQRDHAQPPHSASASPAPSQPPSDANAQAPPKRYSTARIDAVINHGPEPQDNHGSHRRTSSNTALPSLSEMAPESRLGIPPNVAPGYGVQPSPPSNQPMPYPPYPPHPGSAAMGSPRMPHTMNRPSSSPRLLPPPNGMKGFQPPGPLPGSPSMHAPPPNMQAQQHYQQPPQPYSPHRVPATAAPPHAQPRPYPPPPPPQGHPPPAYYPQQPYQDRRTSYPNHQPHPAQMYHGQPTPSQPGMLQFQAKPQAPQTPHQQGYSQPLAARTPQTPQYQQQPVYPRRQPAGPATAPRPRPQPDPRLVSNIVAALATPPRQARPMQKPLWKSQRSFAASTPGSAKPPGSPKRPAIEPLSPAKPRAPAPVPLARSAHGPVVEPAEHLEPPPAQQKRGGRRGDRRAREGSVASSTVDGSARAARSQSVSSIPPSEGRPTSKRTIKNEPSTPAAEHPPDVSEADRNSETGPARRTRRGTLNVLPPPSSTKRKRQGSLADDHDPKHASRSPDPPAPRKNTITANRHLSKMTGPLMAAITENKYGSRFAHAVRDRDAEGYSEIIKRPQDLKSIRSMISAGSRAIAAATAHVEGSPGSASGAAKATDGTVELERSVDLMPPRAIVNGAQLEAEIMRMLANAVMFNPGEDGMVSDTRAMAEDVEKLLADWRGAERELVEDEGEGTGKRRKVQ